MRCKAGRGPYRNLIEVDRMSWGYKSEVRVRSGQNSRGSEFTTTCLYRTNLSHICDCYFELTSQRETVSLLAMHHSLVVHRPMLHTYKDQGNFIPIYVSGQCYIKKLTIFIEKNYMKSEYGGIGIFFTWCRSKCQVTVGRMRYADFHLSAPSMGGISSRVCLGDRLITDVT